MTSKKTLIRIWFILTILSFMTVGTIAQDSTGTRQLIKEQLNVPFGTLVKMTIEVVDGNELHRKALQSSFLIRIKAIDTVHLAEPIVIEFEDETGKLPNDEFALYKFLYGKKTGIISSAESDKMKKRYVGKEFDITGYETGGFTGVPDGYFKYQPVRQDYGFHFRNYIIVVDATSLSK